ncbi:hypothetical protein [Sporosarcina limicola]|uniref:DUF3847 domain-containing protein n=1 Tax=Sporosarcina limicola TaxID=34101 RepID=A0A927RFC6_9BACL|nr:hypothetical protein [Sporosarcina limicola]MBE1557145.1 hypothetical protein [Sporosarcina limicola]
MTNLQLKKLITEKNRLELELNRLQNTQKKQQHTTTLIKKGKLLDHYLDTDHLSTEETEEMLKLFSQFIKDKRPERFNKTT